MCGDSVGSPSSLGRTTVLLSLYVEDADRFFDTAQTAGATVHMPLMDAFWGDRYGQLKDPYGHIWEIATHKKDMSKDEIDSAGQKRYLLKCPKTGRINRISTFDNDVYLVIISESQNLNLRGIFRITVDILPTNIDLNNMNIAIVVMEIVWNSIK